MEKEERSSKITTATWITMLTFVASGTFGIFVFLFTTLTEIHDRIDRIENNWTDRHASSYRELRQDIRSVEIELESEIADRNDQTKQDIRLIESAIWKHLEEGH